MVLSNDYTKNMSESIFCPGATGPVDLPERPGTEIRPSAGKWKVYGAKTPEKYSRKLVDVP